MGPRTTGVPLTPGGVGEGPGAGAPRSHVPTGCGGTTPRESTEPSSADHAGAMMSSFPFASYPVAVKATVSSAVIVPIGGTTSIRASKPGRTRIVATAERPDSLANTRQMRAGPGGYHPSAPTDPQVACQGGAGATGFPRASEPVAVRSRRASAVIAAGAGESGG